MSQSLNLAVAGLYTSLNDYNGLPQGALDAADNVESRYKNVLEPRRGFDLLAHSSVALLHFLRLTDFYVGGTTRVIGLDSSGNLVYYTGANPWPALPGNYSADVFPPDSVNAKCRFIRAGQNLYVTSSGGIRSLPSGSASQTLRAGVPKGLNLAGATTSDTSGFLNNNIVVTTTGNLSSGTAIVTSIDDSTEIEIGQYVTGDAVFAHLVVQDLTYTSVLFGILGNSTTIAYTTGGTAGSEVVTVVGSAISVKIQSGVSTATQIRTAVLASAGAIALVGCTVSGTGGSVQTAPVGPTALAGGLDNSLPVGTKVSSITESASLIIETGNTTAGSASVTNLTSIVGIVAGVLVSGVGIPSGAKVLSTSGAGPYTAVLDRNAFQTATGISITFASAVQITLDQNALASVTGSPLSFYTGSEVAYTMVFGRVETDIDGGTITRLGAPSAVAIVENISPYSTNTTVTGTLPKNASDEITFVRLYRSPQTPSVDISPLAQYNLVYERVLTNTDFMARTVTITDDVSDSLVGIPLYSGTDQEGILQSNDPPPMAWDMCKFRDFTLFGNITQPSSVKVTVVAVGSPSGVQSGDTITVAGEFLGVPYTETYTAAGSEVAASRQFKVFSSGTPSQNIANTADSLIRVVNYDEALPVHLILLSGANDLPGQIFFEADNPSIETFTVNASAHTSAYDPVLSNLESNINTVSNNVAVSKSGQLEAVPAANVLPVGDSSSALIRLIPLRDYVIAIKSDGIYKIVGTAPGGLTVLPFDLTTKIRGAETAVSLNSAVWMLSNQGVVSISDGGVEAKSVPIDDQLNTLIGSFLDNLLTTSFAVGYESDRKYILSLPDSDDAFTTIQYCYNYVTNSWTTWSRNLYAAFVHSQDDLLYIARADSSNEGVSKERKAFSYKDYVDEGVANTITSVSGNTIGLSSLEDVEAGDILYQDATHFSPILSVDLVNSTVEAQYALSFVAGAVDVLNAYLCTITWKQVFADNPAFVRQYAEGVALFKNTRFNEATVSFVTDYSQAESSVTVAGTGNGLWGLFPWGTIPWGGTIFPSKIRFLIPQDKQLGSYILPTLKVKQGYSDFRFQGMALFYTNVSPEVGL